MMRFRNYWPVISLLSCRVLAATLGLYCGFPAARGDEPVSSELRAKVAERWTDLRQPISGYRIEATRYFLFVRSPEEAPPVEALRTFLAEVAEQAGADGFADRVRDASREFDAAGPWQVTELDYSITGGGDGLRNDVTQMWDAGPSTATRVRRPEGEYVYEPHLRQASVFPESTGITLYSLEDFRFIPPPDALGSDQVEVFQGTDGLLSIESPHVRILCEETTGIVVHYSLTPPTAAHPEHEYDFTSVKELNGLRVPALARHVTYRGTPDGGGFYPYLATWFVVREARRLDPFPADALDVPVPAGEKIVVFDRSGEADRKAISEQPIDSLADYTKTMPLATAVSVQELPPGQTLFPATGGTRNDPPADQWSLWGYTLILVVLAAVAGLIAMAARSRRE